MTRNILYFGILALLSIAGCGGSAKVEKSDDPTSAHTSADESADSSSTVFNETIERDDSSNSAIPASSGDVHFSLKFLSWNVESEGSDPATISKELAELGRYDVVALTEVLPNAATDFCNAFGNDFQYIMTDTGRSDRMMLIYNKQTLDFVRQFELHDINVKNRYRSPLVAQFRDALTGKELLVMVNHLARGSKENRQAQATKLVEWARNQTMPIVALGDYNFDYVFETRKGNEAFRLFMKDNVWQWIEPFELIDTNWYDDPKAADGKDDYPGSMLDFAFVAGPAKKWTTSCKVIVREGDFPDNEKTSDHRPYELIVSGR